MANNKKSFLLYCDLIHTVEFLDMKQRGEVLTWVLDYVNGNNPENLPGLMQAVVEPIKQQLNRDLDKYKKRAERSRVNGQKGGRPKTPDKPSGLNNNPDEPRKPDSDTDTVTDTVSVTGSVKETVIKKNLVTRKADFKKSLFPYVEEFSKETVKEFFEYWSEHGAKDKKMRFEKEKSFGTHRRLGTWKRKEKDFAQKEKKDDSRYIKEDITDFTYD